jgi:hypothetical protein
MQERITGLSNFLGGKFAGLKGLSYEIDLKNVDKNWQILALGQAALHSALFNYTPLVISGDWQKYAGNIIKPTQTSILPQ